ncbi:MAG TPA: CAP domain-containing protein [Actinoplanes sp.]|nr:CAP domain-containing protein [Actinoplanes sp.]
MWKKALLSLAVPALLAVASPASAQSVVSAETEAQLMSLIVTKTNQVRHAAGCDLLDVDQELVVASVRQSDYMADTGTFGHIGRDGSTFVTRAHAAGYAQPSGENIAWGFQTADEVMAAWMASPPHRSNILNCGARSIGTGVRYAADGTPYYTQVFGWQ